MNLILIEKTRRNSLIFLKIILFANNSYFSKVQYLNYEIHENKNIFLKNIFNFLRLN